MTALLPRPEVTHWAAVQQDLSILVIVFLLLLLITTLSQRLGFKSTYPPILARAAQKVLELLFQNTLFALKFVLNSCYYTHLLMENKLKNFQIWLKNSYSLFSPGARDHSTKSLNSFLLTRYTYKDRAVFVVVHTSSLFLGKSPEMPW